MQVKAAVTHNRKQGILVWASLSMLMCYFCRTLSGRKTFGNRRSCTFSFLPPFSEISLVLKALFLATIRICSFPWLCVSSSWQHPGFFVLILMTSIFPYSTAMLTALLSTSSLWKLITVHCMCQCKHQPRWDSPYLVSGVCSWTCELPLKSVQTKAWLEFW